MNGQPVRIDPKDIKAQQQVERLLSCEGLRRDPHLDYTCGIFDDKWNLLATGSCFRNTLRCLAVSKSHRGCGLLSRVVNHLIEVQALRGHFHLFLYTAQQNIRYFEDLGFCVIVKTENGLAFMENRLSGFADYLHGLSGQAVTGKQISAVVMNANPFTLGHRHLAEVAVRESDAVYLFVLREENDMIPFSVRFRLVQEGTRDLKNIVLCESGPYMVSAATFPSYFVRDEDEAIRLHAELDLELFAVIAKHLNISRRYVGREDTSHVTALYNRIMKEKLPARGIECRELPRKELDGKAISASIVRRSIHDGRLSAVKDMLPASTWNFFCSPAAKPVIEAIEQAADVIHH